MVRGIFYTRDIFLKSSVLKNKYIKKKTSPLCLIHNNLYDPEKATYLFLKTSYKILGVKINK